MNHNRGSGVVEIILVLTVLIVFVLIFREKLIGMTVSLYKEFAEVL